MGKMEAAPRPAEQRGRHPLVAVGAICLLLALGAGVLMLLGRASRRRHAAEERSIAACARDAVVLDHVSRFAWSSLYPDTDHFLGNASRPFEPETLRAVAEARRRATATVKGLPDSMKDLQDAAREMYVSAAHEGDLAADPRGNWLSFMSETTRARSDFERAKLRFESSTKGRLTMYNEKAIDFEETTVMAPVADVARQRAEWLAAKAESERREREAAAAKEILDKQDAAYFNARDCAITDLKWNDLIKDTDFVEGEITNNGDREARWIVVEIRYRSKDGQERTWEGDVSGSIPPHGKKSFFARIDGWNSRYFARVANGANWRSGHYERIGY